MNTKDLLAKPDDQLTDYERQIRYGEGGDPRKLNPFIDQAFLEVAPERSWDATTVFQKAIRIGRGHANPKTLFELVQDRITTKMKDQARSTIQAMIDENGLVYSTEAQRWHYVRANVIQTLYEVSRGSVSLDVLMILADEVIADCKQANNVRAELPRRHDEPSI
jgi:hypothetical protein